MIERMDLADFVAAFRSKFGGKAVEESAALPGTRSASQTSGSPEKVLVDTSIWVDHLREGDPHLRELLEAGSVVTHPKVIGELACALVESRDDILGFMMDLPALPVATDVEALALIQHGKLMGRGLGYVDVHLLASVMLDQGAGLWTREVRLALVAKELGVAYDAESDA